MARLEWRYGQAVHGLEALQRDLASALKQAALQAGAAVVRDALEKPPTVPMALKLGGTLRRSWSLLSDARGQRAWCDIFFNTPYAASMHEGGWKTGPLAGVRVKRWSTPGSGPKYLEAKLRVFGSDYISIASQALRQLLRG